MLEQIENAFPKEFRAFQAMLPAGTDILDDANAVPPQFRFFAGVVDIQLNILPQEGRHAAPAYVPPGQDGKFGPDELSHYQRVLENTRRSGTSFEPIGLAIPPGARWPSNGAAGDATVPVFRSFPGKSIVFCVDRDSGAVTEVVKLPLSSAALASCTREFRMLTELEKQNRDVAPRAIRRGHLPSAGDGPVQYFAAQSYVGGNRPSEMFARTILKFLDQLAIPDQTVTLAGLAAELKEEMQILNVPEKSRNRIESLLNLVNDATGLPAAIGHGDCWQENFVRRPNGKLAALDWENSRDKWLGFLDVIQTAVCENYVLHSNNELAQVFTAEKMRLLNRLYAHLLPPGAPALEEILTFHVCHHYVDRVVSYGGLDRPGLQRLDVMIHDDLPF